MLRRLFHGWVKKKEGTAAIEFALMAFPFTFLILGIIEISMMYAAATLLEGATANAARMIKTGQIQEVGDPQAAFRQALCNYATVLVRCDDIVVEVQPMASFDSFDQMQPTYDEDGNMVSAGFNAGASDSKMLIRTAYRYTMMNPFVGRMLLGESYSRLFMSTVVFQTEPYDFEE